MHGGGLPWNSECTGGLLGLEFRMHEGVSSPGIPKGGGGYYSMVKNNIVNLRLHFHGSVVTPVW